MRSIYAFMFCMCFSGLVHSEQDTWKRAALIAGVSEHTLYGIALQESGMKHADKKLRPWPWTVNSPKGSMRFNTKEEAYAAIKLLLHEGVTNIDMGAMQINLRAHWMTVKDRDILDPHVNVMTAAEILRGNMAESRGDVEKAVALYHSRNKERGENYQQRVAYWEQLVVLNTQKPVPSKASITN